MDALVLSAIIGGGIFQAISTIEQGRAARAQGEAEAGIFAQQAAIAERNALLAERQAEAEQQAAVEAARQQEREGEALKGRQRALFAKAGVLARGTPLSVIVETAENLEADRLTILREGFISAAQARGRADISRLQAGVSVARGVAAKARGRAAGRAATLAAGGTILTTVGQAGYTKYQFGR